MVFYDGGGYLASGPPEMGPAVKPRGVELVVPTSFRFCGRMCWSPGHQTRRTPGGLFLKRSQTTAAPLIASVTGLAEQA